MIFIRRKIVLISILILAFFFQVQGQGTTKILSYNIQAGMDSIESKTFVNWAKKIQPDIVAYQELSNFTQASLENLAEKIGHPYAVIVRGYVGISSKYPISKIEKITENMYLGYIYAQIKDYHVFVLHLAPHIVQKRREEIDMILARSSYISKNENKIIMGDFNALSPKDEKYYSDPRRLFRAKKFRHWKYDGIKNFTKDGEFDYTVISKMIRAGYYDTHLKSNTDYEATTNAVENKVIMESGGIKWGPTGGPARIDYIWVNKPLLNKIKKFEIIKDTTTKTLSDHFPVFLELYK